MISTSAGSSGEVTVGMRVTVLLGHHLIRRGGHRSIVRVMPLSLLFWD
jgi:hypothetical protein